MPVKKGTTYKAATSKAIVRNKYLTAPNRTDAAIRARRDLSAKQKDLDKTEAIYEASVYKITERARPSPYVVGKQKVAASALERANKLEKLDLEERARRKRVSATSYSRATKKK
jgi:hypothetical protein